MIYEYECPKCGSFEVVQSIHDEALTKCECGQPIERIVTGGLGFRGDPRTLGTLAERNTAKLGHYERESKFQAENEALKKKKEKAPWWRPNTTGINRKLLNMTPEQTKRYIERGNV